MYTITFCLLYCLFFPLSCNPVLWSLVNDDTLLPLLSCFLSFPISLSALCRNRMDFGREELILGLLYDSEVLILFCNVAALPVFEWNVCPIVNGLFLYLRALSRSVLSSILDCPVSVSTVVIRKFRCPSSSESSSPIWLPSLWGNLSVLMLKGSESCDIEAPENCGCRRKRNTVLAQRADIRYTNWSTPSLFLNFT